MLYHLKLLSILQRLYLIFLVVKLTTTSNDTISRRYFSLPPNTIIINREEE